MVKILGERGIVGLLMVLCITGMQLCFLFWDPCMIGWLFREYILCLFIYLFIFLNLKLWLFKNGSHTLLVYLSLTSLFNNYLVKKSNIILNFNRGEGGKVYLVGEGRGEWKWWGLRVFFLGPPFGVKWFSPKFGEKSGGGRKLMGNSKSALPIFNLQPLLFIYVLYSINFFFLCTRGIGVQLYNFHFFFSSQLNKSFFFWGIYKRVFYPSTFPPPN